MPPEPRFRRHFPDDKDLPDPHTPMKSYPDPYRHFENLDSAETQNFAAEANAETRARF